ncbi:hypothetical protein [Paradevosia shaoguanensis]|uniref:hypothetical protein n=1 Tax=Paradevosia shaoguanensis TaxID=1335043 RepID=UPI003C7447A6
MPDDSANMITIGGVSVDIEQPCLVLRELRKTEIAVAAGESVSMTRFDQDEVRFTPATISGLGGLIAKYEQLCAASQGRRRRGARVVRWGVR